MRKWGREKTRQIISERGMTNEEKADLRLRKKSSQKKYLRSLDQLPDAAPIRERVAMKPRLSG